MPDTFTLILETSTPQASLATVGPDHRIEQREFTSDRSANARLFSPLQELLSAHQAEHLERVLVGSGPGSYSGTRVGIAAAQGVAIASGCPAIAVPSVLAVPSAENGARCLAIGDARRGSYWTVFIGESRLDSGPELTDADGLSVIVRKTLNEGVPVFSFDSLTRFPLPTEIQNEVRVEFPSASRLWLAWSTAAPESQAAWAASIPQPIYLKPPHITPAKRSWLMPS